MVIVIVVVVVVVIAVVAVPLAWLFIAGSSVEPDEEKTTVNLASPVVQVSPAQGEGVCSAVLNINKITPKDEKVLWSEVRMLVKSAAGSVLNTLTRPSADTGAYDDDSDGYVDVEFWYVETTTGDNKMSAGDALKVTGMDTDYEGATIEISREGERIGSIMLPTNFP